MFLEQLSVFPKKVLNRSQSAPKTPEKSPWKLSVFHVRQPVPTSGGVKKVLYSDYQLSSVDSSVSKTGNEQSAIGKGHYNYHFISLSTCFFFFLNKFINFFRFLFRSLSASSNLTPSVHVSSKYAVIWML